MEFAHSPTAGEFPPLAPDFVLELRSKFPPLAPDFVLELRSKFPPLAPDLVLELRSKTDSMAMLRTKIIEYMDNGVRLGWLIDRKHRNVEIYRLTEYKLGKPAETLIQPTTISGEASIA